MRFAGDGEVVCVHDADLRRATGGRDARRVAAVPLAELPRLAGGERIPTLAEALEVCAGKVVNVEVKSEEVPGFLDLSRAVARVLAEHAGRAEVVVSSFDPRVVVAMAALAPRVPRGMLVGDRTARLATALPLALRPIVSAAHVDAVLLTPERIARLLGSGLRVAAWTVNDPSLARALRDAGVATIITDRPGEMVAAVSDRR